MRRRPRRPAGASARPSNRPAARRRPTTAVSARGSAGPRGGVASALDAAPRRAVGGGAVGPRSDLRARVRRGGAHPLHQRALDAGAADLAQRPGPREAGRQWPPASHRGARLLLTAGRGAHQQHKPENQPDGQAQDQHHDHQRCRAVLSAPPPPPWRLRAARAASSLPAILVIDAAAGAGIPGPQARSSRRHTSHRRAAGKARGMSGVTISLSAGRRNCRRDQAAAASGELSWSRWSRRARRSARSWRVKVQSKGSAISL